MPDSPLDRQRSNINPWTKIDGELNITKFHRSSYTMNCNIGRPERSPHQVVISPQTTSSLVCLR
jgi:hypothetical protein